MNPNTKSAQATTKTPFQRLVERLIKRIEADKEPEYPGVIMSYDRAGIDDGAGYGDPMVDDRPDFIKEDERGWQVLK